ncbi:MAG: hypothetical protein AABX07_01740 [Nanoarchaeota archaeon]
MDLFLGIQYCRGYLTRFERALEAGELEEACKILKSMPYASEGNRADEMRRNTVLAIGYQKLAEAFIEERGGDKSILERLAKLFRYEEINNSPDDLAGNMRELKKYQELGGVRDLESQVKELESLQEAVIALESIPGV